LASRKKNMSKTLKLVIFIYCSILPLFLQARQEEQPQQDCEQITKIALDRLIPLIQKNDYTELETVLSTIQSVCGENEFTQRMRIFRALLEKKSGGELIADYLAKNYHEILVMRWDYSIEEKYQSIYQNNKKDFNYIPLKHPIDSLLKIKAEALLHSTAFNLTEQEEEIALLFADRIDEFYQSYEKPISPAKPTALEKARQRAAYKDRGGFSIYAGAEFPITGTDPLFKTNPVMGFMYSSPLASNFLYELGLKIRINSNDRDFEYWLDNQTEVINSAASYSIGGTAGYKVFDNDTFIIYPKLGLFFESTGTGLSEVTYYDNGNYYDDEYGSSNVKYHNVNTMRASAGFAFMRHISTKKYIGLEASYHYIPYNWDNQLQTNIQPNYASLQLFFRF